MARCYSDAVSKRHPSPFPGQSLDRSAVLPRVWLVSDARNDAVLGRALERLPRGSGLVFRHYHLAPGERRARFEALRQIARRRGHLAFLAADARTARAWRADGAYGPAERLARGPAVPRLVTVHSLRELRKAGRASAIVLSPVFATRSHPRARALGPLRFRLLARSAGVPVVALGGMTARRATALRAAWAAIDSLSSSQLLRGRGALSTAHSARIPKDS